MAEKNNLVETNLCFKKYTEETFLKYFPQILKHSLKNI